MREIFLLIGTVTVIAAPSLVAILAVYWIINNVEDLDRE